MDPKIFLDGLEHHRVSAQKALDKQRQSELGQFLTPPSIANMMVGMFGDLPEYINLIDPGSGVGTLTAAFVSYALQVTHKPRMIKATAYELEPSFINGLNITLSACENLCKRNKVKFEYNIVQEDFIASSVEIIKSRNSFFSVEQPDYNVAILNPPYKKIQNKSYIKGLLKSVDIDTTNLYTAFMWLVLKLLRPDSDMVAIIPRSFCNGVYFRPFRNEFLKLMRIKRVHVFESRTKAFKEGDVLQENIILHARKTDDVQPSVIISTSDDPEDDNIIIRKVDYEQVISPDDPEKFIRVVPDDMGHLISGQINNLSSTLKDLDLIVSTGRVVDFRIKSLIKNFPDDEIIPLFYPYTMVNGYVVFPLKNGKKPSYLSSFNIGDIAVPAKNYVFVKRFTSKEEKKRISAAVFSPENIPVKRIGIENHINFFYRNYRDFPIEMAKGLTAYLNSTLVDQYFRQFSGHTQVNVADLRNLKYPKESQLIALGKMIGDFFPEQDELDRIVDEVLELNNINSESNIENPIMAKKKIKDALRILQILSVPKAQQNDRSALTLLALVNVTSSTSWRDASENLIGITEMMDYFRKYYGINYAPNTRETVRRYTIHQFMQMGLVIANPDDPTRPINSPKNRYIIDKEVLKLVRSYETNDWEANLRYYIKNSPALNALQVRERIMPMIPVILPDGEKMLLSSGGQNELIKKVIEDFCPRFTPGGKVIYIGDAGQKLTQNELKYLDRLGIKIDMHGKMPDVIVDFSEKKWIILIEAVTSHGPIDIKRHNELKELFKSTHYGLVFVTAFENRKSMHKYLTEIAWETEVWIAESPSHLIHFNGEKFLGPYTDNSK